MRWYIPAILAALLGGCAIPVKVSVDTTCDWTDPFHFSDETKRWIVRDGEPPKAVRDDLEKIAKHNDKGYAICPTWRRKETTEDALDEAVPQPDHSPDPASGRAPQPGGGEAASGDSDSREPAPIRPTDR